MLDEKPLVIDIDDPAAPGGALLGEKTYEEFLEEGDPEYAWENPADEWDAISLNYTSGTTGDPKGVVTHHRGAYLNAVSNIVNWGIRQHPVYLWTLPMFHCNGWCFPWSDRRARGGERVPAPGRAAGVLGRDPRARRDASVRRAHRLRDADQRAGDDAAGRRPHHPGPGRRRVAAGRR